MMRSRSLLLRLSATAALFTASLAIGQSSLVLPTSVLPRIKTQIDDNKLTKLTGNVSRLARPENDRGEAVSSTQLTHIRLVLSRSTEQETALNQYLADLQDKSSSSYHKWLTPEQFGKLYGPADSDLAAIVAWLESRGLKVEPIAPGRTNVAFSGTVRQVEEAFHVRMHSFEANGQSFFSNVEDPSIPTALAPLVSGIAHLNTMRPTPHHIASQSGRMNPSTKRLEPISTSGPSKLGPNLTVGKGTSNDPYFLYMVPGDAATIYDTPNTTYNRNYTSGTSYDGTGIIIGIGGDAIINESTVEGYTGLFLGKTGEVVNIMNIDGVTSTDNADEAYIDTELSSGLAPGASIDFYTSTDLFSGVERAISDNFVSIFSLSFGACELGFDTADNASINSMWQQAAAQGIAVTVSTGDSGSAGCDATSDGSGDNVAAASDGLAVNGLASTPYNIAVGGTDMDGLLSSFSTYVDTNSSSDGSNGAGSYHFGSALKYIPESTWNDSTQVDGKLSANYPYTATGANIVGGSGGKSSCSTNTTVYNSDGSETIGTCTKGYAKPTWQRGTGVPSDSVRDLPDVSLMAGNGYDPATWLICTDDTTQNSAGVTVTQNCAPQSDGGIYFTGYGGTSTAAPAFAGILALVEQKAGGRLGQAAVELYDLYNGSNSSSIFHDTTIGNNSVSCVSGTPDCALNAAGNYYLSGYDTTTGYDLATGMGSVDAKQLVSYWGSGVGATKPTVKVTPSASSITHTQSLSVAVAVTGTAVNGSGANATPTGTVTLTSGTYTSSTATLTSGAYTFTIAAGTLAAGADTLTASYSGDVNFASATGTASVTATTAILSVSPTSLTFPSTLVGSSAATQASTLKNTGTAAVTISSIAISGTDASSFGETNTCGSSIATSDSCAVTVTFTPKAAGTLTATISITDNTGTTQTIALSGTGAAPAPVVTLSSSALTFASTLIGSSAVSQAVTVKNTGTASLTISKISISGANASSFAETTTCAGTLAVSATCTITATFTPTAAGTLTASIGITDNASASSTITLTGTGTSPTPVVSLSSSALTFASTVVGVSTAAQTVTVKNTGTAPLTVTGITIDEGSTNSYTVSNGCATVAIGATCSIGVVFTPTTIGTITGSITIKDNAAASSTISLTGTGVEPAGATFTLTGAPVTIAAGATGTSAITASTTTGYVGTITLSSCTLTASPTGAVDLPACSITTSAITLPSGSPAGAVSISTTAAASSAIRKAQLEQRDSMRRWTGAGSLVIAGLLFFGIPARNRKWRSLLGAFAFLAILGFASGCGGGGGKKDPGTTPGTYTFTVTGMGSDSAKTSANGTISVIIN